ncbi:MAG: hypothetical protein WCE63_14820 [Acidobacteriaceae bacterium]
MTAWLAETSNGPNPTTANEYMQELPESVKKMVGSVYTMLMKGGESRESLKHLPQKAANSSEGLAVSI